MRAVTQRPTGRASWVSPRGLICLLMICLFGGAIVLVLGKDHNPFASSNAAPIGHQPGPAYAYIVRHAAFHFHLPAARGYRVYAGGRLAIGLHGSSEAGLTYEPLRNPGDQLWLDEGVGKPTVLHFETFGKPLLGSVVINGQVWHEYRNDNPILATTMPDGVQVAISGFESFAQDIRLAARVPVRFGG